MSEQSEAEYQADLARADDACREGEAQIWTTRDGRRIPVREMTDSHLMNTIEMLERKAPSAFNRYMLDILSGPQPQGEMAQDALEMEFVGLEREGWEGWLSMSVPQYEVMLEEAERRGLKP